MEAFHAWMNEWIMDEENVAFFFLMREVEQVARNVLVCTNMVIRYQLISNYNVF